MASCGWSKLEDRSGRALIQPLNSFLNTVQVSANRGGTGQLDHHELSVVLMMSGELSATNGAR